MTFNCFDRELDKSEIEDAVSRGDYSFQEYAIFDWFHHVDYLVKREKVWSNDETSSIKDSLALLCTYHLEQGADSPSSTYKNEDLGARTNMLGSLENLRRIYECTDTLSEEGWHQGKSAQLQVIDSLWTLTILVFLGSIPYLVRRVVEVRRILEDFSAEIPRRSPILTEAYGKRLFKCPIVDCTRFYRGFENTEQRDKHLGQHERAHKCIQEGCDYRELGFPTEVELRGHVELCHNALPEEPTFPNVQRVNLSKALNDAIDRDDVQAVRDICSEVLACPLRQTGFVLRAVKRRSISTALVLVELLGTDVEMNHVDSKGRTVLHEAVRIRNDDLFDRILDTKIDVEVRDRDKFTPFLRALEQGYFHAIRLLMDHPAVNIIPRDVTKIYEIYYIGMKAAAAGGVDDILKALSSYFVSVSKSKHVSSFGRIISGDLMQIIAKAASNRHESTVKLILELAHALDLESMYEGLLKKELHHGIGAMTKFLMQRYGEAKHEIGKNGKTYGNALANAAMKNDTALVMRLLKDGADIDYADKFAYNALGAAASRGNLSMVSFLLEHGAEINAKGGYSGNALYFACRGKHMAVVDFLFEKGADVNARLMSGETALAWASSYLGESLDAVQLLVGKAADVNLQNDSGETALLLASQHGHKEIVEILVQGGADVNLQEKSRETALFRASASDWSNKEIIEILVQGGAIVNLQTISGETALFAASRRGYKEIVEILVQGGAIVNLQTTSGETALFAASRRGYKEIVEILVQGGADVNLQTTSEESALFAAIRCGYKEIVEILVQGGVDINLQPLSKESALFAATRCGYKEIVKILVQGGANVNLRNSYKQTALFIASSSNYKEIVEILVQGGADVNLQTRLGESALFTATRLGYKENVKILIQGGADVNLQTRLGETALSFAIEKGKREVVQVLMKADVDLEVKYSHQRTALLQAAERGWEDIVQILIKKGADINSVDADQQTALLIASAKGYVEVVLILLASGADDLVSAPNTALVHGHGDALQLLLKQASPIQQRNAAKLFSKLESNECIRGGAYENALFSACSFGLEEFVKILLEVARFNIPVETCDEALRLKIGTRRYLPPHEYEAIAKLLRETRATSALWAQS